ncbi:MAG TPA: GNAT family N-acetyltransferase [Methanocella sp.]|uniref:GNAT family N-acetyltransferase n=1 Tax=Methanocella sp. TaxID=2052833 RepID=UPI002CDB973E|nr:GNAT family N-acetyltransferase [Methanocella sp.]HTY91690.1 GNAT family N-acetyltransferase [Methanocella sp.]
MLNARVGRGTTEGIGHVFSDAARTVPVTDLSERRYINNLMDRARQGELGVYTLMRDGHVSGVICYRALDGDAELVFGHVIGGSCEAFFLKGAVDGLFSEGMHTIRSNFNWPDPRGFIPAARDLGFIVTERMGMSMSPVPAKPSYGGFDIMPWKDAYLGEVCRIMCENQAPADLPVYPMFSRPEGVRALMDSVVADRHGRFLRRLSFVASSGGRLVGFIVSTMLSDGSILILDLGVDGGYRKKGIGGALLDRLIGDAYREGHGEIVLAVTSNNYDAIRLYERKGFKVNGYFRQHVLSKVYPANPWGGTRSL